VKVSKSVQQILIHLKVIRFENIPFSNLFGAYYKLAYYFRIPYNLVKCKAKGTPSRLSAAKRK